MQYSQNQRESALKANLADYFRRNGYRCEKHGSEIQVHSFNDEFKGLWVNEKTNQWYCFSESKGGRNPIDCLTEILKMESSNAIHALSSEAYQKDVANSSQNKTTQIHEKAKEYSEPLITVLGSHTNGFDVKSMGFETNRKYTVTEFNAALVKATDAWFNSSRNDDKAGISHLDSVIISIENVDKEPYTFKFNLPDTYLSVQDVVKINSMPLTAKVSRDAVIEKLNEAEAHHIKSQEKNQGTELEMPINEHEKKRVFAYLIKERNIDAKLVQELVEKKLLYQGSVRYKDKDGNEQFAKGNAVFVRKDMDGNIVGAEIHGTNTYKRFKKIAGSGEENSFQYAIGTPKKVYAFESTIDLLSFKMLADPEKIKDSLLVSMGGLKPNALKKFEAKGLQVYSCVDNDESGRKFNEVNGFKSAGRKLSEEGVKDWNELLKKRVRELSKNIEAPTENAEKKKPTHKSPRR